MLGNLYPVLLHKMENTQDAILDAMDRLEIWLDSFGRSASSSPNTKTSISGKKIAAESRAKVQRRTSEDVFDSSDDSDEEDGER